MSHGVTYSRHATKIPTTLVEGMTPGTRHCNLSYRANADP